MSTNHSSGLNDPQPDPTASDAPPAEPVRWHEGGEKGERQAGPPTGLLTALEPPSAQTLEERIDDLETGERTPRSLVELLKDTLGIDLADLVNQGEHAKRRVRELDGRTWDEVPT